MLRLTARQGSGMMTPRRSRRHGGAAMDYTGGAYWSAVINASLCKFLILHVVCETPMHGYGVIRRLSALTGSLCVPTQGTVYPVLQEFAKCGCVCCRTEVVRGRTRKVYAATPKGRQALAAGTHAWRRGLTHLHTVFGDIPARPGESDALRVKASSTRRGRRTG